MKVAAKVKEIAELEARLKSIQPELITAIFEEFPSLESVGLYSEEEYNDNNYSTYIYLTSMNGVSWDDEDNRSISCINCCVPEEDADYRSWLVEAKLRDSDFRAILDALSKVSKPHLANKEKLTRKGYIKC